MTHLFPLLFSVSTLYKWLHYFTYFSSRILYSTALLTFDHEQYLDLYDRGVSHFENEKGETN